MKESRQNDKNTGQWCNAKWHNRMKTHQKLEIYHKLFLTCKVKRHGRLEIQFVAISHPNSDYLQSTLYVRFKTSYLPRKLGGGQRRGQEKFWAPWPPGLSVELSLLLRYQNCQNTSTSVIHLPTAASILHRGYTPLAHH